MQQTTITKVIATGFAAILLFAFGTAFRPQPASASTDFLNLVQNTITAAHSIPTALFTAATAGSSNALVTKEYILDPLANTAAKIALQSITKSTVNWINSGFNGSPAFVTDLSARMQTVSDVAANSFINQLATNASLKSPFQSLVANQVRNAYFSSTGKNGFAVQNAFTLGQFSQNPAAFLAGDNSQGGFNAGFAAGQPQNNPFGALLLAQSQLSGSIADSQQQETNKLNWGSGFASFTGSCNTDKAGSLPAGMTAAQLSASLDAPVKLNNPNPTCIGGIIKTPGAILNNVTAKALNLPADQLNATNEFNEIVGALFSQLVSNTLNNGLSSLSNKSAGGGASAIDQATDPSQLTAAATAINLTGNLMATVVGQRTQLVAYQSNLQTIQTAAATAKQACTATNPALPQTVLDQMATALANASKAITALDGITTQITAIGKNTTVDQTAAFQNVSSQYQQLLASGTLPTIDQITQASSDSQDSGSATPASLYTQLAQLTASCTPKGP